MAVVLRAMPPALRLLGGHDDCRGDTHTHTHTCIYARGATHMHADIHAPMHTRERTQTQMQRRFIAYGTVHRSGLVCAPVTQKLCGYNGKPRSV